MSLFGNYIERRFLEPGRRMKASAFEELGLAPGNVVFLGDSITEGGAWHEWFPDLPVANRGIAGDTAAGVRERLGTAIQGPPAAVFLLIGTNDLSWRRAPEEIAADVDAIVAGIRTAGPDTAIVVQSVMPRTARFRPRLEDLNDRYQQIARRHGAEYLDLWPTLADEAGNLRSAFTLDSLHLSGPAYRAWAELLRKELTRLGILEPGRG